MRFGLRCGPLVLGALLFSNHLVVLNICVYKIYVYITPAGAWFDKSLLKYNASYVKLIGSLFGVLCTG